MMVSDLLLRRCRKPGRLRPALAARVVMVSCSCWSQVPKCCYHEARLEALWLTRSRFPSQHDGLISLGESIVYSSVSRAGSEWIR